MRDIQPKIGFEIERAIEMENFHLIDELTHQKYNLLDITFHVCEIFQVTNYQKKQSRKGGDKNS